MHGHLNKGKTNFFCNSIEFRLKHIFYVFISIFIATQVNAEGNTIDSSRLAGTVNNNPCSAPLPVEKERFLRQKNEIPPEELIDITVGELRFKIPHAYLAFRSGLHTVGCRNYWKHFGFSFWWPSLEPTLDDARLFGGFIPEESTRPKSDTRSSVIHVRSVYNIVEKNYANSPTPERQLHNIRSYLLENRNETEEFGLLKLEAIEKNYPFVFYSSSNLSDVSLVLRCNNDDVKRPFPSCGGDVLIKSENTAFYIYFLKDEMPNWKSIIEKTQHLLRSWRVP